MIRHLNTNSILENRIAKLEKRLHIKNESKLDIVDAIHMGLEDDIINESQLINECLAIRFSRMLFVFKCLIIYKPHLL